MKAFPSVIIGFFLTYSAALCTSEAASSLTSGATFSIVTASGGLTSGGGVIFSSGYTSSGSLTSGASLTLSSNYSSSYYSGGTLTSTSQSNLYLPGMIAGINNLSIFNASPFGTTALAPLSGNGVAPLTLTPSPLSGTLTLGGDAVLKLGSNTVPGGTLPVAGSTVSFEGQIGRTNNLIFNSGATLNSGVIVNSGGLVKAGSGTLALSGTSTYTGATTVTGGTLVLSGTPTYTGATITTVAGGTLTLGNGGTTTSGAVFIANPNLTLSGSLVSNSTLTLNTAGLTAGTIRAFPGIISLGTGSTLSIVTTANQPLNTISPIRNSTANTFGTTTKFLDGVVTHGGAVSILYLPAVQTLASDPVSIHLAELDTPGTSEKFVLQMTFDPTAAAALGDLTKLYLAWFDPADGAWKNAVDGNSDGGASSQLVAGAYDPATDFNLGTYGVDTTNSTVWAVVDHDGKFGAGADPQQVQPMSSPQMLSFTPFSVPEPSTAALLVCGLALFGRRSRKR